MPLKNILGIALLLALLVLAVFLADSSNLGVACTEEAKICPDGTAVGREGLRCEFSPCPELPKNYKNSTYTIDGQKILLKEGYSEREIAPGSASKIITDYFGNEATGDLNGDGIPDTAFLLTQSGGGSGTFFYAVVALKTDDGYVGTNGVFLGDRIAPQTTEIRSGEVIVNYATRRNNEPMTASPSIGVSKYLTLVNGMLVAVKK